MYSSLILGLAVMVAAPGAKDLPKKEASIVGDWILEKMMIADFDLSPKAGEQLRFSFANDGKVTVTEATKKPETGEYKLDVKKDPAHIDMLPPAEKKEPPLIGIFKIDGDTLTICCVMDTKETRPTKFESTKETKAMMLTFKRAKK